MSSRERSIIFILLGVTLVLRIIYALRYTIDSDEPQHLHVVWGWANGLIQYHDVFDNHTPLFHMLFTPFFALVGEHQDILFFMRLAMLPLYAVALWTTYSIGRTLFSQRAGAWAAVLTGLFPSFFLLSVEFRTDDLWTVFWLLSVAVLISGPVSLKRSFAAGILLGAAAGVSLKTTLLAATLASSAIAAQAIRITATPRSGKARTALPHYTLCAAAMCLGAAVIPAALALFFLYKGAFGAFLYGTIQHNIVPGMGRWGSSYSFFLLFPLCLAILWWGARFIFRSTPAESASIRRVFIFFIAGIYIAAMESFWPLVTVQNYLPVVPFIFIMLTPLVLASGSTRWAERLTQVPVLHRLSGTLLPVFFALFEIGLLLAVGTPWHDGTLKQRALLKDVLAMTDPGDPVFDLKGEMVFRRRSFYYALETITGERIKRGLIADDIPERMIATGTCVVTRDHETLPPRTRSFLLEHFLPVGNLRVAGQFLPDPPETGRSISFDITVPGRYALLSKRGEVRGLLDGVVYDGPRVLACGRHEFVPLFPVDGLALVWAKAAEKGFSPFSTGSEAL